MIVDLPEARISLDKYLTSFKVVARMLDEEIEWTSRHVEEEIDTEKPIPDANVSIFFYFRPLFESITKYLLRAIKLTNNLFCLSFIFLSNVDSLLHDFRPMKQITKN